MPCIDRVVEFECMGQGSEIIAFNRAAQVLVAVDHNCLAVASALTGATLLEMPNVLGVDTSLGPGDFLFGQKAIIFKRDVGETPGIYAVELFCHNFDGKACYRLLPGTDYSIYWMTNAETMFVAIPTGAPILLPYTISTCIGRGKPWVMGRPIFADNALQITRNSKQWVEAIESYTVGQELAGVLGDESVVGESLPPLVVDNFLKTAISHTPLHHGTGIVCDSIFFMLRLNPIKRSTTVRAFLVDCGSVSHLCTTIIDCLYDLSKIQATGFHPCAFSKSPRILISGPLQYSNSAALCLFTYAQGVCRFSPLTITSRIPHMYALDANNNILSDVYRIYLV